MIYVGYLILCTGFIRLSVAFINLVSRLNLPKSTNLTDQPLVSILIPARNEQHNINNLLKDIQSITYSNYEVIICNDGSTDSTTTIVQKYMAINPKISMFEGLPLEDGWMGKSYACNQLAAHAGGQYYLFLDADVRIGANLVQRAVCHAQKHKTGLLSIFPRQILDNCGAWLSVPLMNRILLSLLPLVMVRTCGWISFSAANGQFMLFDAASYNTLLSHAACRNAKAEDIAICQYYKRRKIKTSTLLGDNDIRCRMYGSLNEAVSGFSKNIVAFFGNSPAAALSYVVLTTLAPFALYYIFGLIVTMIYISFVVLMQIFISISSRQNIVKNMLLMPLQQVILCYIIFNVFNRKTLSWKGRPINSST